MKRYNKYRRKRAPPAFTRKRRNVKRRRIRFKPTKLLKKAIKRTLLDQTDVKSKSWDLQLNVNVDGPIDQQDHVKVWGGTGHDITEGTTNQQRLGAECRLTKGDRSPWAAAVCRIRPR